MTTATLKALSPTGTGTGGPTTTTNENLSLEQVFAGLLAGNDRPTHVEVAVHIDREITQVETQKARLLGLLERLEVNLTMLYQVLDLLTRPPTIAAVAPGGCEKSLAEN